MARFARLAPWLGAFLLVVSVAASAQDAFTTRTVNVRAGPDTSYPAVAALGPGTPVQVVGCLDDWSWCDVVFDDNRGWVYSPYLSYVYQGYRVPFYSYAPTFGIPIITFSLGSYWDRYYRGRPWYGRRDYWERRVPVHVRPAGPPPRSTPPTPRAYPQARPVERRGYDGNRTWEGNRPPPARSGVAPQMQGPRPSVQNAPPPGPRGAEVRAAGAPPRNAPQATVERAHGEHHEGPPPSRGGGEQRAAKPSGDRGEHRGQGGQGEEKQR